MIFRRLRGSAASTFYFLPAINRVDHRTGAVQGRAAIGTGESSEMRAGMSRRTHQPRSARLSTRAPNISGQGPTCEG